MIIKNDAQNSAERHFSVDSPRFFYCTIESFMLEY